MRRIVDDPSREATPNNHGRPNRTYVFVVTALAVFLLGLIVWRSPVFGYVAAVVIDVQHSADTTTAELLERLSDEKLLMAAVNASAVENENSGDTLARIQNSLKVEKIDADTDANQFRVSIVADTPAKATSILGQVASRYVAGSGSRATTDMRNDSSSRQHPANHNDSLKSEQAARNKLDQHVDRVFGVFVNALEAMRNTNHDDGSFFNPLVSIKASTTLKEIRRKRRPILNPEWVHLEAKIKPLREEYDRLLNQRTEEHPIVQQLKSRIDLLTQVRDSLSKTIAPDDVRGEDADLNEAAPNDPAEEPGPRSLVVNPKAMSASIEKFTKLHEEYKDARELLEDTNSRDNVGEPATHAEHFVPLASVAAQPRIIARLGGTPSPQRLLVLGVLSCLVGGVAAWKAKWRKLSAIFRSVDQVERELKIPVAGVITTTGPVAATVTKKYSDRISIGALKVCESILALIVVVIVLYTVFDSPFANDLVGNPLGTISQMVGRSSAT